MAAEPETPQHPIYSLTTYELKEYRRQLERALDDRIIGSAPIAASLREKLEDVRAEEESRLRLASHRA